MAAVNVYNAVYRLLAADKDILELLGLTLASSNIDKAKKLIKRKKPPNLTTLPIVTFYALPGGRDGENKEVYVAPFMFDIYTNDDVDKAQKIAQRIIGMFDGVLPDVKETATLEAMFVTEHESETNQVNTYCYSVGIDFAVVVDKARYK
ncbi:hypothetical protein DFP93_101233 [Aneurinibacillus soli]|uniref:Uncharacterized protein n=1 Tax=Aneurinibacillus soli TaxID=1500254 RepID=A0A0U5BBR7_9BACL|nr:hypothetical protein [Aneurinibacillus soli]PYE64208.1 hypothetical protein DFP93_101233 [Aneurinibacillus soli]BAU28157.1 hypothetical protein CB4_02331 [Aneurinibacillus soli]